MLKSIVLIKSFCHPFFVNLARAFQGLKNTGIITWSPAIHIISGITGHGGRCKGHIIQKKSESKCFGLESSHIHIYNYKLFIDIKTELTRNSQGMQSKQTHLPMAEYKIKSLRTAVLCGNA